MSEEAKNKQIWAAIRKNLLEEEELKAAWAEEEDGFGFKTYEEYVDKRIITSMKQEVTHRDEHGSNLFTGKAPKA